MIIVVYHNINATRKLEEFAKIAFGFDVDLLVISKPTGTAAQMGVPEIHKEAFKKGKNILIVGDLSDAIEVVQPEEIYTITKFGESADWEKLRGSVRGKKVMFIFGGTEPGLSKKEIEMGIPINVKWEIGELGELAILLHELKG